MIFFKLNRSAKGNQLPLKVELTPVDWILEFLALIGLLALLGLVIYYFPRLPETIPTHFNGSGQPDDYGGKSDFWMLPGISVFTYILLTLVNLVPHKFNYIVTITPQNAMKQYTMGTRMVRYIKLTISWLFFYINFSIIQSINHPDHGLGLWFLPVFSGFTFIPIIVYFLMSYKQS